MTAPRSGIRALLIYALIALAGLALAVEGSQPLHDHRNASPGLYNAECALAVLAAFHSAALLPASPLAASFERVTDEELFHTVPALLTPPPHHNDPRAPPF